MGEKLRKAKRKQPQGFRKPGLLHHVLQEAEEVDYLLRIEKGERMWKTFVFRPDWGRDRHFEYRILTKEKRDGHLELVSYDFKIVEGMPQKSNILRAPDVPKEALEDIVRSIAHQTNTAPWEFEEIDLSGFATVDEQVEYLKQKDRVESAYVH